MKCVLTHDSCHFNFSLTLPDLRSIAKHGGPSRPTALFPERVFEDCATQLVLDGSWRLPGSGWQVTDSAWRLNDNS